MLVITELSVSYILFSLSISILYNTSILLFIFCNIPVFMVIKSIIAQLKIGDLKKFIINEINKKIEDLTKKIDHSND